MTKFQTRVIYIALLQAIVATLGSLYFSEVKKYNPCVLCWYQRIAMYPLIAILAVGVIRKSREVIYYVLPLSIIGFIIAAYHNLLYWNVIPKLIKPCVSGVSCTTKYFEWFGFITIPLLSLIAFTVINVCIILFIKKNK